ncbi:hypothetical protein ACFX2A_005219 [Malus domestica]
MTQLMLQFSMELLQRLKDEKLGKVRMFQNPLGIQELRKHPEAIIKAPKRKKAAVIKASDPDPALLPKTTRPTLTRKSKRARPIAPPKSSAPSAPVPEAGRKKQQSSSKFMFFFIKLLPFSFI